MTRRAFNGDRIGKTRKVRINGMSGHITVNETTDREVHEIFIHGFGMHGQMLQGWADTVAILFSIAMQHGATLAELAPKFTGNRVEPFGETDDPDIPWCWSIPDYIMQRLVLDYGDEDLKQTIERKLNERRRKHEPA